MARPKDITGLRYGRLEAIWVTGRRFGHHVAWLCACDCGVELEVSANHLRQGHTQSCGCLSREATSARNLQHGYGHNTRGYSRWIAMKARCTNLAHPAYKSYGGRGIWVYGPWLDSYELYREHILNLPNAPTAEELDSTTAAIRLEIDRRDNDRGYEPGNLRWVTRSANAQNKRGSIRVKYRGREMGLADACRLVGRPYQWVYDRLMRGWPALCALGRGFENV